MSLAARAALVRNMHLFFQRDSQRSDLLSPDLTQTDLIAYLIEMLGKGHILELTAVRSDHSDDSCLGLHSHADGYCVDLWPLNTAVAGDYCPADSPAMRDFLIDSARSPWLYQIGLAGSADISTNESAAGRTVFSDDGADHVHIGTKAE